MNKINTTRLGASNYPEFLKFVHTQKTRVLSFINISKIGLETSGCATGHLIYDFVFYADLIMELIISTQLILLVSSKI